MSKMSSKSGGPAPLRAVVRRVPSSTRYRRSGALNVLLPERAGDPSQDRLQHPLARAKWDADGAVADLRATSAITWVIPKRFGR
jgi:hypothetical protein